jgi:hypothetical protein
MAGGRDLGHVAVGRSVRTIDAGVRAREMEDEMDEAGVTGREWIEAAARAVEALSAGAPDVEKDARYYDLWAAEAHP